MKTIYLHVKDFLYITPASVTLGAWLASFQGGSWFTGFLSFTFLFLLAFSLFTLAVKWTNIGRTFVFILALTFALRFLIGVALYIFLPIYGYDDADDQAGYVFTDAHGRDDQAWKLASSGRPIFEAFSKKFPYDQYGGLLAFSAFVYRYLSPDAHRPLMLILLSAIIAALGIPFLWQGVKQVFGEKSAWVSTWTFALYPESILLGTAAMREPYLLTFGALMLYGFVGWRASAVHPASDGTLPNVSLVWLGIGFLGMLLVSPAIALITLIIFAGWIWFTSERGTISWKIIIVFILVFMAVLFILSASLNRSGTFNTNSPLNVINDWLRLAVNWNVYQIERESGWVQILFDEMPEWVRLPFVVIYGVTQPVLPATLIVPTTPIWKVIYILRALGWYALLPMLILSFGAEAGVGLGKKRKLILWLSLLTWTWILLAALRGGGDLWDNPRYRTILFLWQAILAGVVWVWWRETRSAWLARVVACEAIFLIVFTQWYTSRYFHWGGQLPFAAMVTLIFGLWVAVMGLGWWQDRKRKSMHKYLRL